MVNPKAILSGIFHCRFDISYVIFCLSSGKEVTDHLLSDIIASLFFIETAVSRRGVFKHGFLTFLFWV
jgi:hypothetical protein